MMHGAEKSDSPIVPKKPANKARRLAAESAEGSGGIERNAGMQSTVRTQSRAAVSQAQARIREAVNRNKGEKLTALLHHVTIDTLRWAYYQLRKDAAPGLDGTTWADYAAELEENLEDLHNRIHTGAYRAQPSRRQYIPKADGRQRPLGIAALEDKIVQQAVVAILTPIYESEFLGFSYGFRPGRSQHDALDALAYGIKAKKICWILDADISRFFDTISHEWLIRFLEHRIGDRRIIRLVIKWLKAGVLEEGERIETTEGTPQGAVISPLLANIYLHYVYDRWVHQWRGRHAQGDMIVVRFADDTVVGFQHKSDGERFLADLKARRV
jgi:RNA-directed DNA polymerase